MEQHLPRVIVAHPGARMHYAVPVLLCRSGLLEHIFTSAYTGEGSWLRHAVRFLPGFLHRGWLRRLAQRVAEIPANKVTAYNWFGLQTQLGLRWKRAIRSSVTDYYLESAKRFLGKVSASNRIDTATAVYAFTSVGLELFEVARRKGLYCVCEQMRAPIRELAKQLREEHLRWPGWQSSGVIEWDEDRWTQRETKEWELADAIIAPSEYVASCLIAAGVEPDKVVTMPYGVSTGSYPGRKRRYDGTRRLRVLFIGTVNLRKGVPYLLDALREIGPDEAQGRFVGTIDIDRDRLAPYVDVAHFVGGVSRKDVLQHYDWADVLIMPSVSEGSATVTYEALACGLPIVATSNSGAWVRPAENGLVVPVRDSHALADSLRSLIRQPALVEKMSEAALESAPELSWDAYQRRLSGLMIAMHHEGLGDEAVFGY